MQCLFILFNVVTDAIGNTKVYGDSSSNPQTIIIKKAATTNQFGIGGSLSGLHATGTGTYATDTGGGAVGGVGSKDKWGVVATYGNGLINYDWDENFRSDGKRFDFNNLGNKYLNCELIGYFAASNPPNDEVSAKMGGGPHSRDGQRVNTYDIGIHTLNGKLRYRIEEFHPDYSSGVDGGGSAKALGSRFVGYKAIKIVKPSSVYLEVQQDIGNNEGSTPANQWVKKASWTITNSRYIWRTLLSGHQETWRIDGSNGVPSLRWKWISLREIRI